MQLNWMYCNLILNWENVEKIDTWQKLSYNEFTVNEEDYRRETEVKEKDYC